MNETNRLCIICKEKEFKYKCPGCLMVTCSLECITIHKVEFNCDGKRDLTPFKKIEDFGNDQFLQDFGFLEEGSRLLDNLQRDRKNIIKSMDQLPPWLKKLVYEARCRGTRLKLLPAGFDKRSKNKTTFMYDKKIIRWDVGLIFTHITERGKVIEKPSSLVINRVDENKSLKEILMEVINPHDVLERLDIWKFLTSYRLANESTILMILTTGKQFYEVNPEQSLAKSLEGKTIIEYPTFIITFNEFKDQFPIVKIDETSDVTNTFAEKDFFGVSVSDKKKHKNDKRKREKGLKSHVKPKIAKNDRSESNVKPTNDTVKPPTTTHHVPSDVSSLSTDDDEDYNKFVNIGFARTST